MLVLLGLVGPWSARCDAILFRVSEGLAGLAGLKGRAEGFMSESQSSIIQHNLAHSFTFPISLRDLYSSHCFHSHTTCITYEVELVNRVRKIQMDSSYSYSPPTANWRLIGQDLPYQSFLFQTPHSHLLERLPCS